MTERVLPRDREGRCPGCRRPCELVGLSASGYGLCFLRCAGCGTATWSVGGQAVSRAEALRILGGRAA
ncbi:MAG: hypothetical protein JWN57_3033 [Frankiales bacterium]|nr:hypothetical protein [Frankiales bacterium]